MFKIKIVDIPILSRSVFFMDSRCIGLSLPLRFRFLFTYLRLFRDGFRHVEIRI